MNWRVVMRAWLFSAPLVGAIAASLFFVGFNVEIFAAAMLLLLTALLAAAWSGYRRGWSVPLTPLTVALSLYWGWLAITLLWSPVYFISALTFWWLSCLPLGFWIYWLMPERERIWDAVAVALAAMALALAVVGVYQVFALHVPPQTVFLDVNIQVALLNLVTLPAAGFFLGAFTADRQTGKRVITLGVVFTLLAYGIMLTKGRGGIAAFLSGVALLAFLGHRHVPRRALAALLVLTAVAFVTANLSWGGGLVERIGTVSDLRSASTERLLIWQQSLALLEQSPLWGLGLGLYSLFWPPYRDPLDLSAGFFVHNDYLQIWIEAGLPGLLLFLGMLGAIAAMLMRIARSRTVPVGPRLEIYGLAAGLGAISLHGLVQYNFYVVPILIVFGLFLGRIQDLAQPYLGARLVSVMLAGHFSPDGFRLIALSLMLVPGLYLASVGASAYLMSQGVAAAQRGELEAADGALAAAHRLWPDSDAALIARADLHRIVLAQLGNTQHGKRRILFENALHLLDRAEQRNPLRPTIYLVRAALFRQAPALVGKDWAGQVDALYRKALQLNPRYYGARFDYARFLLGRGEAKTAREVLEDGLRYLHAVSPPFRPYLSLAADLSAQAGDAARAAELRQKAGGTRP